MNVSDSTPSMPAPAVATVAPRAGADAVRRRVVALVVFACCAAVLGVAAWLEPAAEGHGTHTSLGLPPCGWVATMGVPCPTCGMTTSFAHAAEGNMLSSVRSQPLGFLLAIATAMTLVGSLYVVFTGAALGGMMAKLWRPGTAWLLGAVVLGAWLYKILSFRGLI